MCEKPQAFRSITRKARKPHKCCECGRVIATGQHYEYSSGIWDGEPSSFKTCLDCASLRDNYQSFTGEVFVIGELYENLLDLGLERDAFGVPVKFAFWSEADNPRRAICECFLLMKDSEQ